MSENPEEMHPDHRRAPSLRVEEMSAEIAIDEQHDLSRGQRTDGQYHQPRHHNIEPGEQRHFSQRHSWATHAKDGSHDVDRRADAAKAGDQQRKYPEIRAMTHRKCS